MTPDPGAPDDPPAAGGSDDAAGSTGRALGAAEETPATRRATSLGRRVQPPPARSAPRPRSSVATAPESDETGAGSSEAPPSEAPPSEAPPSEAESPEAEAPKPEAPAAEAPAAEAPEPGDGPPPTARSRQVLRGPRPQPFGRRRVLPVAIVFAIVAGIVVAVLGSAPDLRPIASASATIPPVAIDGYLVSVAGLRQRAADAARGIAPFAAAVDDLQAWAENAVKISPQPVQPLVVVGNDNVLVSDASRAYGLGLAYVTSGDERFAAAAAATIRAWVGRVKWADDICPDNGGCHTTLSISRAAAGFAFGADLIAGSPTWTADDIAALKDWLRTVILPAASERPNNWGDAGTFLRVAVAAYLGDESEFDAAIAKWRSLMDLVEASGRIPEESRRGTAGISYTQEALQYKLAVARIAESHGIDLWDTVGAKGGSLKGALDRLAYFSNHPQEWPDAANAEVPAPGPAWEIAYAHWQEPAWVPFVQAARPYGDRGHSALRWTTLTNGIPIDPIAAEGSPPPAGSPSPPAPSPSPTADPPATSEPSTAPPDGPGLTDLRARLVETAATGDVRVRVTWTGPAGADAVRLDWSGSGSWHRLLDSRRASGSTVDARPAGTVAYRGRLTDGGHVGPWRELPDVTTERIDAGPGSLALDGDWAMAAGSGYSGGRALSTAQSGATATWRGRAGDLLVIGPVGPSRGQLEVIVDGRSVATVSLHAASYVARRVLATVHFDLSGDHEVVLRAIARPGASTVAVDEIVRLETGVLSSPGAAP